jgi:hypothetical protein
VCCKVTLHADLLTNPELTAETLARIRQKLVELAALKKIEQAKANVSEKIKQRMEALQRMLEGS